MWKDFWKSFIALFTLAKELEQTRSEVKETRKDLTKLAFVVQELANEIKLNRHEDQSEREKMALRIDSELEKTILQLQIEVLKVQNKLLPAAPFARNEPPSGDEKP